MFLQVFDNFLCTMISTKTGRSNIWWVLCRLQNIYLCCALGRGLKLRKSVVMLTVVIAGFCQPDEVNLRLIHIRQIEVLFQFHANNYHSLIINKQNMEEP